MERTDDLLQPCPKCGSSMEEGFIPDAISTMSYMPVVWVQGKRETSTWTGIKMQGKSRKPVTVLRCTDCGYLELYAK